MGGRRNGAAWVLLLLATGYGAGCSTVEKVECSTTAQCATGEICRAGFCRNPTSDAGDDPDLDAPDVEVDSSTEPDAPDDIHTTTDAADDTTPDTAAPVDAAPTTDTPNDAEDAEDAGNDSDTTTDTGVDAGVDTGTDTDADTDADSGTDADADTGTDTTVPPPRDEICNDGADNNDDGLADCEDPQCVATIFCVENPCDLCTGRQVCVGGTCEEPVAIGDYVPAAAWSYISGLTIPDEDCCFDFTGDGVPDNAVGEFLPLWGSLIDDPSAFEETFADAIIDDEVVLLLEYREWPGQGTDGPAKLSFFLGTNDLNGDGVPDQDFDSVRAAGEGVFRIHADSFGPAGALNQANTAYYSRGTLTAGPSTARVRLPALPGVGPIEGVDVLDLTIHDARFEAPLDNADFRFTRNSGGRGGGRFGGVLQLDQLFSVLDDAARGCGCAGIDARRPAISYGPQDGFYEARCEQQPGSAVACGGWFCENLGLTCQFLPLIVDLLYPDIDTTGSGVRDAVSLGAYVTMVSATLDDDWYE